MTSHPLPLRLRRAVSTARSVARAFGGETLRTRYEARYGLLRRLASRWGMQLYNANLAWTTDDEYQRVFSGFRGHAEVVKDRPFVLYSMARSVANLDGDTAECGVLEGAGSFLICAATEGAGRSHHIFDSFEGLSEPEDRDRPSDERAYHWRKHDLSVPLDTVRRNLRNFTRIDYHQGWIPTRFEDVADRQFCFVHVDVDLYQPTRDSLAFFYPRMVPGGIILCDDYGSTACPGAKQAFDELVGDLPEQRVIHLPTGQGFIVRR